MGRGTRRKGYFPLAQSFQSPCSSSFASFSSSRYFSTCLRASLQSSICSGRHKLLHRRILQVEDRQEQGWPGPACSSQMYSARRPGILMSKPICQAGTRILHFLTGAQTYSGAQTILQILAQLFIRLYNGKDHSLTEGDPVGTFCNGIGKDFDMCECS